MTLKEVIDFVDHVKPNAFSVAAKVRWLEELDGHIAAEELVMNPAELETLSYSEDALDTELLVKKPYDDIYALWLEAKIDYANGEYEKYQNSMQLYNQHYGSFVCWFAEHFEGPRHHHGPKDWHGFYFLTAYGLAVKHGKAVKADGTPMTEEEWVESLKGEKGDKGDPVLWQAQYDTLAELTAAHPTGEAGDCYLVGTHLYWWDTESGAWADAGSWQGPQGVSPTVNVVKENGVAIITFTTAAGDTVFKINDGSNGVGVESITLKSSTADGNTYTVALSDGTSYEITAPTGPKGNPFTYDDFTPEQLAALKGSKGDPFTYADFTPEQLAALKGEKGDAFTYEDFTPEQLAALKGEKGAAFTYDDFTPEQLAALKGEKGDAFTYADFTPEQLAALKGEKGDAFVYADFTPEQLEALRGPAGTSIQSIVRTAGTGAPGTTDTYTVTLTDGSTTEFYVYNGKDGEGAGDMTAIVYDPQGKKTDVFRYVDDALEGKQDALTGVEGQVVGFGTDGKPVAQAAPSGLPVSVEILETICENIELTDDNPSYTFPAAITLDADGLYYLYHKYYDAEGNLKTDWYGGEFSRPISGDDGLSVTWLGTSRPVMLTSTGITDACRQSGHKSVLTIVKVSSTITDELKFDAVNREGFNTTASGYVSHAEGEGTTASGGESHAEGYYTAASGDRSHAEGSFTAASGIDSHAEGEGTTASDYASHAEGESTTASGYVSHAEGYSTTASDYASHAEGESTTASGYDSHAEGYSTTASGVCSHAEGDRTTASNYASHAQGKFNKAMTTGGSASNTTGDAMVIGNGTKSSALSNAFRVTYAGAVYGLSAFNSTGADYSEFFEWADLNPNAEDRVGCFVTLEGKQIRIANPGDYILGIVSGQPCIIGNADEDWQGRWLHDEFGRFIKEATEDPVVERRKVEVPVLDEDGNPTGETRMEMQEVETGEVIHGWRYKANPDYDNTQQYIERKDRPEWDCVGMLGVLAVRDDGTCEVNGFCQVADGGIATAAESYVPGATYRVIERVTDNVVKVIFR